MPETATITPQLLTVGRMADLLDVPIHRVEYLLRTRTHIKPIGVAGRVRLYNRAALAHMRHELVAISARHTAGVEMS